MIVNDNTIGAKGLGKFFRNLETSSAKVFRKLATNGVKNPRRAVEVRAKLGTATVSKNSKASLATFREVKIFRDTGEGFYLGKFV